MSILTALIGPIADVGKTFLNNRAEEKQAKHKAKMSVIQNDANWEAKMADASSSSLKDEFWTIILAIPIFMVGYAIIAGDMSIVDRTKQAFQTLNELPEWYQYLLFICISSSFGIKGASKLMDLRK
tara:strand:- start:410 stop:787 length:378 start_codon:yes stop_codon:yes gene_type:complete